jgi:hypothetical protein
MATRLNFVPPSLARGNLDGVGDANVQGRDGGVRWVVGSEFVMLRNKIFG